MNIEITQCPQLFQDAVNEYLTSYRDAKVLAIVVDESTPYKDKNIVRTTFKAYIEYNNLLVNFKYSLCSKEEWNDHKVYENSMVAGDIRKFIDLSWWFSEYKKVEA